MTTLGRKASASQFDGVFAPTSTPVRRDDPDELADPGPPVPDEATTPPAALPAATSSTPPAVKRRQPRPRPPAPMRQEVRRTLDVEARRYLAARRKLEERTADLTRAVDAAESAHVPLADVTVVFAAVGLAGADLPPDLAARLAAD